MSQAALLFPAYSLFNACSQIASGSISRDFADHLAGCILKWRLPVDVVHLESCALDVNHPLAMQAVMKALSGVCSVTEARLLHLPGDARSKAHLPLAELLAGTSSLVSTLRVLHLSNTCCSEPSVSQALASLLEASTSPTLQELKLVGRRHCRNP